MKRIGRNAILLLLCLVMTAGLMPLGADAADGDVEINETNFPDEVFREYIGRDIDRDRNGVLSEDEINETEIIDVTAVSLAADYVSDLKGIEFFTNLNTLLCRGPNIWGDSGTGLSTLDISQNLKLEFLSCECNILTDLDVSHNTALDRKSVV